MRRGTALAVLLALSGCAGCDDPSDAAITECEQPTVVPGVARTDILFVIDDSGSMSQEQDALQENFGAFVQELQRSAIRNEFQIGVTTTSVERLLVNDAPPPAFTVLDTFEPNLPGTSTPGPNGGVRYPAGTLLMVDPASVTPDDPATTSVDESDDPATQINEATLGRYVLDGNGAYGGDKRIVSSAAADTLDLDFRTNALVGIYGSAKEEGLRAARLALSDRLGDGANPSQFLRSGARLAVIIVTDEDDCSDADHNVVFAPGVDCRDDAEKARAEPVQRYVDFFRGLIGGELRDVVVAVIAGVDAAGAPAECTGNSTSAAERADRYKAFVDAYRSAGGTALLTSICGDFAETLREIAGLIEPGQTLPLDGVPADWRMLSVSVRKPSGEVVSCDLEHAAEGGGNIAGADAVYADPQEGRPATITFQNGCRLGQGDAVSLDLLCAR